MCSFSLLCAGSHELAGLCRFHVMFVKRLGLESEQVTFAINCYLCLSIKMKYVLRTLVAHNLPTLTCVTT